MLGIAAPAMAQFGGIFSDAPPRPPADVPDNSAAPQQYPSQQYPAQQYPAPARDYPRVGSPAPQPLDIESQPAALPPPPQSGRAGGSIEAQPLPPPPGSTAAPPAQPAPPLRQATPAAPATPPQTPAEPPLTPQAPDQASTPAPGSGGQTDEAALPPEETIVEPPPHRIANPVAVFNGLDKITGRITRFDVKINETVQFGALRVTPRVCYSRPPTETSRTDAFIAVDEVTLQGEVRRIFTGWMFAASPGLHAVEHPIYDVWLTGCKGGSIDVAGSDDSAGKVTPPEPAKPVAKQRSSRRP
jgi:hypothetical protein